MNNFDYNSLANSATAKEHIKKNQPNSERNEFYSTIPFCLLLRSAQENKQDVQPDHSVNQHKTAIFLIKLGHTLIFLVMQTSVLIILYSGLIGRFSRTTKLAIGLITFEGIVFYGNRRRCPLTTLVEKLGSEHGSVSDIFLPNWFAKRIPEISIVLLLIASAGFSTHYLTNRKLVKTKA